HVERGDQVIALAHEALVGPDADGDVQIAWRGTELARVAVTAQADALTVGDAGGHLDLEVALDRPAPAPATLAAWLLGDAAVAVAHVAEDGAHHLPERCAGDGLQLPAAAAALARLDRRARL